MPCMLDKEPRVASVSLGMLTPRMLSRRLVALLALALAGVFLAGLLVATDRLARGCDGDGFCAVPRLRHTLGGQGSRHALEALHAHRPDAECANFPDTSNVLLIMKTGASEAFSKIPNQVMTNLKCLPEFLVFSDMAQDVAGQPIYDSLDTVVPEVKLKNKDFDLYFRQRDCPTDQESCNRNHHAGREAWKLDKYKNVHMAEKTYAMRPGYDWYIFVDADTYVVWPTLMQWLQHLDPADKHYIGSQAFVGGFPFGHGGSGYLVSQTSMRKFFKGRTAVANRWDLRASKECCGDYVFALALKTETRIGVEHAWPTINGERPQSLAFDPSQWCQPIATMHHASAQEVSDIYAFEKERNFSAPMRIKDLFYRFVADELQATREHWDNLSDSVSYLNSSAYAYSEAEVRRAKKDRLSDLEAVAHRSFDDCRAQCDAVAGCFQYRFHNGICSLGYKIKHGIPTKVETSEQWRWTSGWNVKRIKEWAEAHDDCSGHNFPTKWIKPES